MTTVNLAAISAAVWALFFTPGHLPVDQGQEIVMPSVNHGMLFRVNCTAGYVTGPNTVVTAAHCAKPFPGFVYDKRLDIATYTAPYPMGRNTTTWVASYDELRNGQIVCATSLQMSKRTCGKLYKEEFRTIKSDMMLTNIKIYVDDLWPMSFGDSGAPVTTPDGKTLVGIFSDCGDDERGHFMAASTLR